MRSTFRSVVLILAFTSPAAVMDAPEASAEPTATAETRAAAALEVELADFGAQLAELDAVIRRSKGEDRDVAVESAADLRGRFGERLDQLVALVEKSRGSGAVDERLANVANDFIDASFVRLRALLTDGTKDLKAMRDTRDSAAPAERIAIESELAALNEAHDRRLRSWLKDCDRKLAIGRTADKQLAQLDDWLRERAEATSALVTLARAAVERLEERAETLDPDQGSAVRAELKLQQLKLETTTATLQRIIPMMERRGLPTAELSQLLIASTGQITADIFNREIATGLAEMWWKSARTAAAENAPAWLFKLGIFVLILSLFRALATFVERIVRRSVSSSRVRLSKLLEEFFTTTAYRLVILLGVMVGLSQLGVSVGPLLAGLGVAGFILGFALQETLSNFAAGLMILVYRPFDVGDVVNAAGVAGKVKEMTLVSTTILTFDNQRLIVPNSKIWGDIITNVTAEPMRRVDMTFGIGYGDDIPKAERVLEEIVSGHPLVRQDPPFVIKLHKLGESSVDFIVRPWANVADYWTVYWDITREVKMRFDAEDISIPFPQRDVHIHNAAK